MYLNLFLFYFSCILNLLNYIPKLLASPIIGGQEDTLNNYKYHVSIQHNFNSNIPNSSEHFCGGTIIDVRYILSVAHPFLRVKDGYFVRIFDPKSNGVVVLSGTSETHGSGFVTPVDKILIPQEYGVSPVTADISILKLADDLNVEHNRDKLEILRIDEGHHRFEFYVNKNALIVGNGWDTLVDGHPVQRNANKRQFLHVHMTPRDKCQTFNYLICALAIATDTSSIHTICKGDSGSPIVFDNIVIGVVSQGPTNCNHITSILSTRVSRFINFISNAINEHGDHSEMYLLED